MIYIHIFITPIKYLLMIMNLLKNILNRHYFSRRRYDGAMSDRTGNCHPHCYGSPVRSAPSHSPWGVCPGGGMCQQLQQQQPSPENVFYLQLTCDILIW